MRKFLSTLLTATLLGANLAVPRLVLATDLPLCSQVADPAATRCIGPDGPTGPAETTEATGASPSCTEVADPTTSCVGPQSPTGPDGPTGARKAKPDKPEYEWVWNGTAWEAKGYPYVWNGTSWVPAPPPVVSATNEDTGPNSNNEATASTLTDTDADIANKATIENSVNADLNTGDNAVTHNTEAGDITSGNIKASVELVNFINSYLAVEGGTITMADVADPSGDIDLGNLDPKVMNAILAYYVGSIFDIIARNTNTGPSSQNNADASAESDATVDFMSDSSIKNDLNIAADTGNNNASSNTEVGDMTTGDIEVIFTLMNFVNSMLSVPVLDIAMVNVFGDLMHNILLPDWMIGGGGASVTAQVGASNEATGPSSANDANASSSRDLDVEATRDATIENNFDINTNTGGNTMDRNTQSGSLETGNTNIEISVNDFINQIVGDSWFLVFVNVLGKWTGEILGVNPADGSVVVLSGQEISASNQTTGPDSQNSADASAENSLDVNATQNADIENNVNLDLNTGGNTMSNNTKAGNLKTGNITVLGNVVNMINQAVNLNKRLFFGFVNVMGDWFGSIGPKSSFPTPPPPAVGGSPDVGGGDDLAVVGAEPLSGEVQEFSTETRQSRGIAGASSISNDAGIASGESIASAEPSATFAMPTLPGSETTGKIASVATWKLASLGLLILGLLLLTVDYLSRRRKA